MNTTYTNTNDKPIAMSLQLVEEFIAENIGKKFEENDTVKEIRHSDCGEWLDSMFSKFSDAEMIPPMEVVNLYGIPIIVDENVPSGEVRIYDPHGEFVTILAIK